MNHTPNQHLIIIAPTVPPGVCGVSDYAHQTARVLAAFYKTVTMGVERLPVAASAAADVPAISVARWQPLLAQATTAPAASDVLLNYTPTSYARSGLPLELLAALRHFTRVRPQNRLFIFFHETWNGSPDLRLHHLLQARITRWSMHRLGKLAQGVAVVNAEQQRKLEILLDCNSIHVNAIGANILPISHEAGLHSIRQPGTWLIFGLAHTRLWTLQAHLPLLQAMRQQGALRQLLAVGPTDTSYAQQEAALAAASFEPNVLVQLGALPPVEVSRQLLGAEAALVGLNADGLKKSGTLAALAAHAVPIICAVDAALTQPPATGFLHPDEVLANPAVVASAESERRRRQLHEWFWTNRSWEAIGHAMHGWLRGPG